MSREQIRNAFGSYISYSSLLEKEGTGLGLSIVRQLAAILEMAAITGNVNFIREHFDEFYSDLEYTIQGCEQELEKMRREHPQEEVEKNEVDDETLKKTVQRLAEALDSYELSDIEETLDELDHMQLSDEQSACLERIKEYYDDVEYELAAEETKKLLE